MTERLVLRELRLDDAPAIADARRRQARREVLDRGADALSGRARASAGSPRASRGGTTAAASRSRSRGARRRTRCSVPSACAGSRAIAAPSSATGSASTRGATASRPRPPTRSSSMGFAHLRLSRIYAQVLEGNEASCRVLDKLGMIERGHPAPARPQGQAAARRRAVRRASPRVVRARLIPAPAPLHVHLRTRWCERVCAAACRRTRAAPTGARRRTRNRRACAIHERVGLRGERRRPSSTSAKTQARTCRCRCRCRARGADPQIALLTLDQAISEPIAMPAPMPIMRPARETAATMLVAARQSCRRAYPSR